MKKLWARVGLEITISDEEFHEIIHATVNNDSRKIENLLRCAIKEKSELSGETYIVGKNCGEVDGYDNPNEEISVLF